MSWLLLLLLPLCNCRFLQQDEAPYLAAWDEIIRDSYSTPRPSALTSQCVGLGKRQLDADKVLTSSMSATAAQSFCGTTSRCVVPQGVTLTMDGNLNVGALHVEGSVVWDETSQTAADQWLCAGYVMMANKGKFSLHLPSGSKRGWIYIKNNGATDSYQRTRVFGAAGGGSIDVLGRSLTRTWSLLATPTRAGDTTLHLTHDPQQMGWQVGDRLVVAPTTTGSKGVAEAYQIKRLLPNAVELMSQVKQVFRADALFIPTAWTALRQAEVVNLDRNIIITGDDFEHVPCVNSRENTDVCTCDSAARRSTCTLGLHTVAAGRGSTVSMQYARVEKCGQRGILGKYCLHAHLISDCPTCVFRGNALEYGQQRGIVIHGTHHATVEFNVFNDIRGGNLYIEDGNELYNKLLHNVMICPWPLHGPKGGCTVPGTDNDQADTLLNQAGLWAVSFTNYAIGNRAANSFNGMLYQAQGFPRGRGLVQGKVCPDNQRLSMFVGNTFHGHGRFGTYVLENIFPKTTDRSFNQNGMVTNFNSCGAWSPDGTDRGLPAVVEYNVDYDNAFVGQYSAGDIQYALHTSIDNNELMYWKETKNFQDGCSAHLKDSYYSGAGYSGFALPGGHGTFIMENIIFTRHIKFESGHHCNVGVTGVLCMPTYVFVNPTWQNITSSQAFRWGPNHGAMFTLGPDDERNPSGVIFPPSFCSLANPFWTYLTKLDGGQTCLPATTVASQLGQNVARFSRFYGDGILCKKPLRRLEIFTFGLTRATAQPLVLELWQDNMMVGSQVVDFFQIAGTNKQGYSMTVVPGLDHAYRISLQGGAPLPATWIIEFSDPVFGNRWARESINLTVVGRNCPSPVHSQHDRRFIWGDSTGSNHLQVPGRGACTAFPDMPAINCRNVPAISSIESCPSGCSGGCNSNSFCECATGQCICKPGFTGANCEVDTCAMAQCGPNGRCMAKFLGGTLPVTSRNACVCKPGYYGPRCDNVQAIHDDGAEIDSQQIKQNRQDGANITKVAA